MAPAGYMAKRVVARPDWLSAEHVSSIYSVSECISKNFIDNYITLWKHNGYWLFDSPEVIIEIAREKDIDLSGTVLFYYEIYQLDFDLDEWMRFEPMQSFGTSVSVPDAKVLKGYDVVSFSYETSPECSPLSCNHVAAKVETNSRCLLQSFEQARRLLEDGAFDHTEPGPFRIFAVYSVAWPTFAHQSGEGYPP